MADKKKYLLIDKVMFEKNVSVTELADRLKVDVGRVSMWKTNKANPRFESLYDIAEALGVSIYELIVENKPI